MLLFCKKGLLVLIVNQFFSPMVIMTRTSLGDEGMEAKRSLQLIHAFPKIDPVQNRKDLTPGPSLEKSDHAQGKFAIFKK